MKRKIIILLAITLLAIIIFLPQMTSALLYYPTGLSKERKEYISKTLKIEEIQISVENDTLVGWFIKANKETAPIILYFGGNAEEVSYNIELFSNNFRFIDYSLALVNYRGYGESSGKPTEKDLFSDAEKIYDYFSNKKGKEEKKIICIGRSLGSGIAVYLASKRKISKVILITPYDSILEVAKNKFPALLVNLILNDKYESVKYIKDVKCPVLLLCAERDEVIPVAHALKLYENIESTKKIEIIENARHNTITEDKKFWMKLNEFIAEK